VTGGLIVAFAVSAVVAQLLFAFAPRLGLIDAPGRRSSHSNPTPRGAGLGIAAGVLAGSAFLGLGRGALELLLAAALVAFLGLADDRRPLSAGFKLAALGVVSAALVTVQGSFERLPLPSPLDVPLGAAAAPFTILWIVAVTNFFNFMDGLDGLAAGQVVLSGLVAWTTSESADAATLGALAAAAAVAILPSNWSPARFFLGDAGSLFAGFLLATLPLLAPAHGSAAAAVVTETALGVFLLDPIVTLVRRARRGAPLFAGHREHAYQRLASPGASHAPVVAFVLFLQVMAAVTAVAAVRHPSFRLLGPAVAVLIASVVLLAAWAAERRRQRAASP
jgi:UDP-N-acetylmuramyl pentapeptide phosphotransferase/UDP-N-acetylglucosamine-1-phosphate transferase